MLILVHVFHGCWPCCHFGIASKYMLGFQRRIAFSFKSFPWAYTVVIRIGLCLLQYKFEEGSMLERATLAAEKVTEDHAVAIEVKTPGRDDLPAGAKVRIGVNLKNKTDTSQKVTLRIRSRLCAYTGRLLKALPVVNKSVQVIGPN